MITRWLLLISRLYRLVTVPIILILLVFSLRRILFAFASLLPTKNPGSSCGGDTAAYLPTVLILVPCRDEESVIGGLSRALEQLEYPHVKYQVVFIDDGSRDQTRERVQEFARVDERFHVLALEQNIGKARALNAALGQFSFGDIIYVFDADHRPEPDCLRRAVCYFAEPDVAGVSGRTIPSNALASASAYYATVESMVHQQITMRAKDRLRLAPALLGSNCGYRRSVLEQCGGFPAGAFLEDSDLTLKIYRAGYRVRYAEAAVAYHLVPESVSGYLKQHARWARGFNDVTARHALALLQTLRLALPLRVELFLFAMGYADRLAVLCGIALAWLSILTHGWIAFPRGIVYLALATPFAQIVAVFAARRAPRAMWVRLPIVPIFFSLDIAAALVALADSVSNRARVWTRTERAHTGASRNDTASHLVSH